MLNLASDYRVLMILTIINYLIRGLIVVLGILLVSGVLSPEGMDDTMYRVMGALFLLFGIYRIITYKAKRSRYYGGDDED